MQGRIERSVLHLKNVFGTVLDGVGDGVAVRRSRRERPENQQVERPLEQLALQGAGFLSLASATDYTTRPSM